MSKLRDIRIENGLTQFELAEGSGVSRGKIQWAERGSQVLTRNEAKSILKVLLKSKEIPRWMEHLIKSQLEFEFGGGK